MKEYLEEARSTNTYLLEKCRTESPENLHTVYTFKQTAGRGQKGNGWESEPGKNLSFTTLFHTEMLPSSQPFLLSMLVPLAVAEMLEEHLGGTDIRIKWPNDVYWKDKKICGILIENVIIGSRMAYSIAGVGINVNQTTFVSGAPNPVSMTQISQKEYVLEDLQDEIIQRFEGLLQLLQQPKQLKQRYMSKLYRKDGFYPYEEREVDLTPTMNATNSDKSFLAEIADIDAFGQLILRRKDGTEKAYHFKQIRYVI